MQTIFLRFQFERCKRLAFNFVKLPQETVNRLLSAKWYGRNFSSSIWRNRGIVAKVAGDVVKEGVLSGQSVQQMSKFLMDRTYTQSMYNATRLIRTEVNYFSNQGALESYNEAELDKYEFCATLDLRTSEMCSKLDGNTYLIDEAVVGENYPPMHPYCRSTVIPIIETDGLARMNKRRARNPETGKNEIIDSMGYKEWRKKYVDNNPKALANEKIIKNKSADQKQYSKYKDLLGKDAPDSLAKFQDLKYNGGNEYEELKGFVKYKEANSNSKIEHYRIYKELQTLGIRQGKVLPPEKLQAFVLEDSNAKDPLHIMKRMFERSISADDVQGYVDNAKIMFDQWNGTRKAFYSDEGVTVVFPKDDSWIAKTTWSKQDYDEQTEQIMKVVRKYVK